jgi:signal transduction histidine kinase
MTRPWKIWLIFALCAAVVLCVMGWVSATALRLDRSQAQARSQAELEEKVRLALWRMDSMLSPLLAQESVRPYFTYTAFHSAERAYGKMFNSAEPSDLLIPSPLLTQTSSNILLHFQFDPSGRLTSPQIPEGQQRELAENRLITSDRLELAAARLREFEALMSQTAVPNSRSGARASASNREILLAAAPSVEVSDMYSNFSSVLNTAVQEQLQNAPLKKSRSSSYLSQSDRNSEELQARAQSVKQAYDVSQQNVNFANSPPQDRLNVTEGLFKPVWFGNALMLVRQVSVKGEKYIQGCWLDWSAINQWLLANVEDLLPGARLEPIPEFQAEDPQARLLASLPVRLMPGEINLSATVLASPIRFALLFAWACVLLAGIALALLLGGTLSLSERRAAFVSAVTHELRTPLTTFKMYSEMLASDMVPDTSRREYLSTLCAEANRLNHLVENVLAYARLERGSARARTERLTLRELVGRVKPRLAQRTTQAGLRLQEDFDDRALDQSVHVDVTAVEQILFNLVDNACKYAANSSGEKIIHLEAHYEDGKFALLRVRDHGQGISSALAKRLFEPFSKSAEEAAHSAPGVGLGLALSRRLARTLKGDLRLSRSATSGACFELLLPLSAAS